MSQFFVVLPSNSSMDLYPNNKVSNFKVNLPNILNLDAAKWEVGLSEIQFQHTWYNVREGKNTITKELWKPTMDEMDLIEEDEELMKIKHILSLGIDVPLMYQVDITIPPGYYTSIDDIIKEIKKHHHTQGARRIKYMYHTLSRRIKITLPKSCTLNMNGSDIERCLGYNTVLKNYDDASKTMTSFSIASTENTYKSIYVYLDIIENQYVGNVKVPLLRAVPVRSKYGDVSCIKYDKPLFVSLSRSSIQTIEINLMDDTGEFISFEAGKAIVTLVFRRKVAKFFD